MIYADKSRVINHYLLLFYFILFDLTLEENILERGEKMEMEMEPERQIEISSHWWLSSLPSFRENENQLGLLSSVRRDGVVVQTKMNE